MVHVRVCTTIDAPPFRVWYEVRQLDRHVGWMDDAVHIRFVDGQREGVGTRFECETKIGRLRTTDRMIVTEWNPERSITVVHQGRITGLGRITLRTRRHGSTRCCWDERITFPWWLGGPVAGLVAWPVLRRTWQRNLANLKRSFEEPPAD
jgi:hypothetical protein